jgi:methyl-accepting chemotaxis protein
MLFAILAAGLLLVAGISLFAGLRIRSEMTRLAAADRVPVANLAGLQRAFEHVAGNLARAGAVTGAGDLGTLERDTDETLRRMEQLTSGMPRAETIARQQQELREIARRQFQARRRVVDAEQRLASEVDVAVAAARRMSPNTGDAVASLRKKMEALRLAAVEEVTGPRLVEALDRMESQANDLMNRATVSVTTAEVVAHARSFELDQGVRKLAAIRRSANLAAWNDCNQAFTRAKEQVSRSGRIGASDLQAQAFGVSAAAAEAAAVEAIDAMIRDSTNRRAEAGAVERVERITAAALVESAVMMAVTLLLAFIYRHRTLTSLSAVEARFSQAVGRIRGMADSATNRAEAMRRVAGDLSRAGETLATTLEAVAASSTRLECSVEETAAKACEALKLGNGASGVAKRAAAILARLETAGARINGSTDLIRGIGFRTKLLALNAAIEAAHAGEAGCGFAVVAAEVKELAASAAKLTDEIDTSTTGMREEVSGAIAASVEIAANLESMKSLQDALRADLQKQLAGTRQLTAAIRESPRSVVVETARHLAALADELE